MMPRDKKILSKLELNEKLKKDIDYTDPKKVGGNPSRGGLNVGSKPKNIRETIARLLGYMGVYKYIILLIFAGLVVATLSLLYIPTLFAQAIDRHLDVPNFSEQFDPQGLYRIVVIIVILAIISSVTRFAARYAMVRISQRVIRKIREDAFNKLMRAPVSYYDEKGSGDIVSRLSNDIELISNSLGNTVLEVLNSSVVLLGAFVLMFALNWALALVVLAYIPIMVLFTYKVSKKTRKGFKEQQIHLASLNGIIEENVSGLKTVKLYNQEAPFTEEFSVENDKLKRAGFMAQFYSGLIWPFIHFMNNIIFLSVIAVGAMLYLSVGGLVTIGHIAGVSQYSRQFIQPIANMAQLFNALMQGIAGAERVFELIDAPDEYEKDGSKSLPAVEGTIEFDQVDFGYDPSTLVLKNVTFTAQQGETIAIVGPTGGGKTTTIKLLNRFYDVQSGTIRIDAHDITTLRMDDLRRRIGMVLQDTHLFKGTVFDNIHYGDFTASSEAVIDAAKEAGADDFIRKLPGGYDTQVHEGGENFSQGERQLISIARTILNNPGLLILDEATSNIDTRTEAKIQQSVERLMQGRTAIVIAHRLQTIQNADTILVIDQGRLIEQGSHETLLNQRGFYYRLHKAQFQS